MLELLHILRKLIRIPLQISSERLRRLVIRSRRAPEAKLDPPGEDLGKGTELLSNDKGCVVRKHDPARAHPNCAGASRHVPDHDRGR